MTTMLLKIFLIFITIIILALLISYRIKNLNKDNFTGLFEVSPIKKCISGEFMRTSDPHLQKLCSKYTSEDIAKVSCSKGYHGSPLNWEYTEPSKVKCNC